MMITIKKLTDCSLEEIHKVFLEAFHDYEVPMKPDFETFFQIIKRRSFIKELSIGAFYQDKLIGFILNGKGLWDEKQSIYNLGTGVIKAFRRQGITQRMFQKVYEDSLLNNFQTYVLEVLTHNTKAKELYLKEGFNVTRIFNCYRTEDLIQTKKPLKLTYEVVNSFKDLKDLENEYASWQNRLFSLKQIGDDYYVIKGFYNNCFVGYIIIQKENGDIGQLYIKEQYRRQGFGSMLLQKASTMVNTHSLSIVNVDANLISLNCFLNYHNFKLTVQQFEMIKNLT